MTSEGFNKARGWATDVPNMDDFISSSSYEFSIWRKTTATEEAVGYMKFSHNFS